MSFTFSHSRVHTYEQCPQMYEFRYIHKLRPEETSSNLIFGGAIHSAIEASVLAHADFEPLPDEDVSAVFVEAFNAAIEGKEITYAKGFDAEIMAKMGAEISVEFNEVWPTFGLTPLLDENGRPLMEQKLTAAIADDIALLGYPDLVAINEAGEIVIIDFKAPRSESSADFVLLSEQLTAYQILVDSIAESLGINKVDKLGYLELKKNKTNRVPRVTPPKLVSRRAPAQVQAYVQKLKWIKSDIDNARFPQRPMMAFNSPCSMCDYCQICTKGDTENLIAA